MNSSFCPLLVSANCDSPFNTPIRGSVQGRWTRVQSFNSPTVTATRKSLCTSPTPTKLLAKLTEDSIDASEEYTEFLSDRFIPNRSGVNIDGSEYALSQSKIEEKHIQPCSDNAELNSKYRVLSFSAKPPENSKDNFAKVYAHAQYPVPKKMSKSSLQEKPCRNIPNVPFKVLDAPGILDDYYLNLLSWSSQNVLAVALGADVYLWCSSNGQVSTLESSLALCEGTYYASVSWCSDGSYLSTGTNDGNIQIWDGETNQKLRNMMGNKDNEVHRIGSFSWNSHILSSGCRGGYILNHDTRLRNHVVQTMQGHAQEVCGLEWSPDGNLLCSGGNDNIVNIWDARNANEALFSFTNHQAAVKAVGWCPFQSNLLATGGGSTDKSIKFWNTATGNLVNSVDTGSQVCSLKWSTHYRELVSSHGYADNQLMLWRFPSMTSIARINAHSSRVLHLALSPDGQTIASAAGDETIKFWSVFSRPQGSSRIFTQNIPASNGLHCSNSASIEQEDSSVFLGNNYSPLSKILNESNYKKLKIR